MRLLLVSLIGAGLVAGGVAAVSAGGQGATGPSGTLAITLVTNDEKGTFVDLPPKSKKGPSTGDQFVGTGTFTGDAKGTMLFSVAFLNGDNGLIHGVAKLSTGDQIFLEEKTGQSNTKTNTGIILGGTGKYAGARGTFEDKTLKETSKSSTARLTLSFVG